MASESRTAALTVALAAALILAIAVAFSPRYWPVAVALGAISLLGIGWAVTARTFQIDLPSASAYVAIAFIAVWGPAQLIFGVTLAPWLTAHASLTWLGFALAFVVASQILATERARHLFLRILLWAVTIFAVFGILQMYGDKMRIYGIFPTDLEMFGTFLYKNQFAAMLELAAPIALWRALRGRENPAPGLLFFAVLFAAAVASAARAGVILMAGEFVVALVIALFRRRIPWTTAGTLSGGVVLLLLAASAVVGPDRIIEHFQEKNPYSTRRQLLDSTIVMVRERPGLGYGIGTWRLVYPRFATFDSAAVANEAHNDWAQWAAEGGIPFSCLMLVLVLCVARAGVSSTWGLGVLAVMLHSLIDYPTREPAVGLLWFALAGGLLHTRPAATSRKPRDSSARRRSAPPGSTGNKSPDSVTI